MKVELQCGDTITISDGCKAVIEGRSPMNGWNIVDDLGLTYERVDWDFLSQHV